MNDANKQLISTSTPILTIMPPVDRIKYLHTRVLERLSVDSKNSQNPVLLYPTSPSLSPPDFSDFMASILASL